MSEMQKELNVQQINHRLGELGMSVPKLAKRLDVSREIIYKWLKKEKFPRPANILQLTRILEIPYNEIVVQDISKEPVVAFRKKGNVKTRQEHLDRAVNMGKALEPLVEFMPFDSLSRPATLIKPVVEYQYIQRVASDVRRQLDLESDVVDFPDLIDLFSSLHAVLIPVLWGQRKNHENALHIYLPESMTTWIYLNLDTHIHDFKFWMAHELGHVKAPDLHGEEGEDFADAFAGALLFPEELAKKEYEKLTKLKSVASMINALKQTASKYVISLFTVIKEVNKYAEAYCLPLINLKVGAANTNFNKRFPLVSEVVLKSNKPLPEIYISSAKAFHSPFFDGLKNYLLKHHKSGSYISRVLNMPIVDAQAIYKGLVSDKP